MTAAAPPVADLAPTSAVGLSDAEAARRRAGGHGNTAPPALLAVAYLVVLAIPAGRAVFALQPLGVAELGIVAIAVAAWAMLLMLAWRHRVVERFLGI